MVVDKTESILLDTIPVANANTGFGSMKSSANLDIRTSKNSQLIEGLLTFFM